MTPKSASLAWADLPFPELARHVLEDLAAGRCAAVVGLSNTGKSTFMRGLATAPAQSAYAAVRGRPGRLLYVDCNRAVAISVQAFYEVVLRSLLEGLADDASPELYDRLRAYHASVTEAGNEFGASLIVQLGAQRSVPGTWQRSLSADRRIRRDLHRLGRPGALKHAGAPGSIPRPIVVRHRHRTSPARLERSGGRGRVRRDVLAVHPRRSSSDARRRRSDLGRAWTAPNRSSA